MKFTKKRFIVANVRMVGHFILAAMIYHVNVVRCSFPCEFLYGGCKHHLEILPPVLTMPLKYPHASRHHNPHTYVPSQPGKLPQCAKPGITFCEKIEKYPTDLIRTLAAKANFNIKTLFIDESAGSKNEAGARPTGHHPINPTFQFSTPTTHVHVHLSNVQVFNQSSQSTGYPDRKYPLDESITHLVDPALYASLPDFTAYNPNEWWKRSERSGSQTGSQRKRRQTAPPSGTELCPTRSQFIMPKAALNNRGEWRYVVNVEQGSQKYTQLVRSETCLTTECNGICSIPNGYTSRCQQKYVQKRLVALEGTGNNLYTDVFWFPHCCVCQIAPDIR